MTPQQRTKLIKELDQELLDISTKKEADYADQDVLSNFKIVSKVVELLKIDTTTPVGYSQLMVVLKICRINNLLSENKSAQNESVEDSFKDGINYFKLGYLLHKEKHVSQSEEPFSPMLNGGSKFPELNQRF